MFCFLDMLIKKRIILSGLAFLLVVGLFFYFRNQVYYSRGARQDKISFEISRGEKTLEIAKRLKQAHLISGKIYFFYYLKEHHLASKIMPGEYSLSGNLTIPEVAHILTNPQNNFIKLTFPEGFTAKQMAERLKANNLPGDDFLKIVNHPYELKELPDYLSKNNIKTLEGYLFPDTYFFKKDASAKDIIIKFLENFDQRINKQLRKDIAKQNRSIADEIIMASLVEKEAQTSTDMKLVAGIFWKRIAHNQKLQSDATLSYILNDKKDQHSIQELKLNSPYNTYLYAGFPPSPICNPGLKAIQAAVYPTLSNYNYFLTVTLKGSKKTIYAQTFKEHIANRKKYQL